MLQSGTKKTECGVPSDANGYGGTVGDGLRRRHYDNVVVGGIVCGGN